MAKKSKINSDLEDFCDLLIECSVNQPLPGFQFNDSNFSKLNSITGSLINYFFDNLSKTSRIFSPSDPIDLIQIFMDYSNNRNWIQPKRYIAFALGFETSSIGRFLSTIASNHEFFKIDPDSDLAIKINTIINYFATLNNSSGKPPSSSNSSFDGGSCYVATLVFNSYDSYQVKVLRKFRDKTLLKYIFGRRFVSYYYSIGPSLINYLRDKKLMNYVIKFCLNAVVFLLNSIYKLPRK